MQQEHQSQVPAVVVDSEIVPPQPNWKIPPICRKSDDCTISIGRIIADGAIVKEGQLSYVHIGEWIKYIPVITVGESIMLSRLQGMSGKDIDAEETTDWIDATCESLARRIIDWNWTDLQGQLLPKPWNNPSAFKDLSNDELAYLMVQSINDQSDDELKNGTQLLPDISQTVTVTTPNPQTLL